MRLKGFSDLLLFAVLITSVIFYVLSLRELLRLTPVPHTNFVSPGFYLCVGYPVVKGGLFLLWFVCARHYVWQKQHQRQGGGLYYRKKQYLLDLWGFLFSFVFGWAYATALGITWCARFGFDPDTLTSELSLLQFAHVHWSIAAVEFFNIHQVLVAIGIYTLKCHGSLLKRQQ